jgi:GAF domain-containing protein
MGLGEQRLERLLEVGRLLVGDLELELVLKRVLEAGRELTGARYAALGILDSRREQLEQFLTVGIDGPTRRELGDLPRGHGVLGLLIGDPRPLRVRSVGDHPQSYGFPHGHPAMESFLGVPVRIGGDVFGNLYLTIMHAGRAPRRMKMARGHEPLGPRWDRGGGEVRGGPC